MKKKLNVLDFQKRKDNNEKFSMITVYDNAMAKLVDKSDIELILVGDSLGNVLHGKASTNHVTIEQMRYHLKMVRDGAPNTFIIGDMSFLSYQPSNEDAIKNAGSLIQLGADCVKMEGGLGIMDRIKACTDIGIPVCAHIGLTPQTAGAIGGFKVQGKGREEGERLIKEAKEAEKAGAFAIVLECIPTPLADMIIDEISIPTIGVGAGPNTTGQNVNAYDLLGLFEGFVPKFVKQYANLNEEIVNAYNAWDKEVKSSQFPQKEHEYTMEEENLPKIK